MDYGSRTFYKSGQWNVNCDVCGFKFKSNEIRKRWDNLMVCEADYEADHPQKYLRVYGDKIATPYVREMSDDSFIFVCTAWTKTAYADVGVADCMQADNTSQPYTYLMLGSLF